ncbi:hypothetical protein THAOC_18653, partial [Thalassiosira oceanica]
MATVHRDRAVRARGSPPRLPRPRLSGSLGPCRRWRRRRLVGTSDRYHHRHRPRHHVQLRGRLPERPAGDNTERPGEPHHAVVRGVHVGRGGREADWRLVSLLGLCVCTSFSALTRIIENFSAKNQATINPRNTIFDVKRLIGRKYEDRSVQEDIRLVPYDVVPSGDDGRPYISVVSDDGIGRSRYAPEEVSAMVLGKLKSDAERYLGRPVDRAVVTVPAYFNDAQRHSTRDAGVIAGLTVERIINEPTAAAIAYGIGQDGKPRDEDEEEENVLVFDLGGGTFDVTLLTIDGGIFEVLATNGDTHLGGSDVDHIVMSHFMEMIRRKDGRDISSDRRALQKLRRECERIKRALSGQLSARLDVEDLVPGYDFTATLTRAKFEELTEDLFRRTLVPVKRVLEDAMLDIE